MSYAVYGLVPDSPVGAIAAEQIMADREFRERSMKVQAAKDVIAVVGRKSWARRAPWEDALINASCDFLVRWLDDSKESKCGATPVPVDPHGPPRPR